MGSLNQYSSIVAAHALKPCRILFAHGSQLDFGELNSRGRQCSCVAMYFLAAAELSQNLSSWISDDLTKILEAGTEFYESVDQKWKDANGFVDVEGLQGEINVEQGILQMEIPDVDHGVLSSARALAGVMEVLQEALERVVTQSSTFIIVTNSYSLGLYVENGFAYIFNSHSCGLLGDSAATGNACVIQIELAEAAKFVSSYIENNYGSRVNLSHVNLHHHTFCIYRVKFTNGKSHILAIQLRDSRLLPRIINIYCFFVGNAVNHKDDSMRPKMTTPGLSLGNSLW